MQLSAADDDDDSEADPDDVRDANEIVEEEVQEQVAAVMQCISEMAL